MYGLKPVPFTLLSFSAACKAQVEIAESTYGLKPVPFAVLGLFAACKAQVEIAEGTYGLKPVPFTVLGFFAASKAVPFKASNSVEPAHLPGFARDATATGRRAT
jgi:hypothetical protein